MTSLVLAGRSLDRADDHLRRYCGLPWSGGQPEVWAYPYYDALPDEDLFDVTPVDVVAAAALHPKLTRPDLVWFAEHRDSLRRFLETAPNAHLAGTNPSVLDELPVLAATGVELSLLTKVLHRKRPGLIPMLDRRLLDWYRFRLHARGAAAWSELVRALAEDLVVNQKPLARLSAEVPLTHLRITDIAIWMEHQR